MLPATVALPCIAALGLLLFASGLYVSAQRARFWTLYGSADDPTHALTKAVRAHGNTSEYAAFLALLIYVLGLKATAPWIGWTMVAVTASRYLLVAGILASATLARPNPLRGLGAFVTYMGGAALALALVVSG